MRAHEKTDEVLEKYESLMAQKGRNDYEQIKIFLERRREELLERLAKSAHHEHPFTQPAHSS